MYVRTAMFADILQIDAGMVNLANMTTMHTNQTVARDGGTNKSLLHQDGSPNTDHTKIREIYCRDPLHQDETSHIKTRDGNTGRDRLHPDMADILGLSYITGRNGLS